MSPQDWRDMGRVYRAGAANHRRYTCNIERQQQAEALTAQADECDKIAEER